MSSTEPNPALSTASDDHQSGKDDGSPKKIMVDSQPAKAKERSSKKRGRPQKVQDAQTPAERRRAQVRLAQRAYRSRQEATMVQLKNRIAEMESVIETMTEAFLAFSDTLMQSGVLNGSPDIAQSLKEVTAKYVTLSSQMTETDGDHAAPQDKALSQITASEQSSFHSADQTSQSSDSVVAVRTGSGDGDLGGAEPFGVLMPIETPGMANGSPFSITTPTDIRVLSPHFINIRTPMSHLDRPDSPFFAQRLHLAAYKLALRYLRNPDVPDSALLRNFGFLMTRWSRRQLISYLNSFLKSSDGVEVSRKFSIPLLNLGGAGLHYPQKHSPLGDPNLHWLPSAEDISMMYANGLSIQDLEEPWFDPEDVEGFLEEQGIILSNRNMYPAGLQSDHQDVVARTWQSGLWDDRAMFSRGHMFAVDEDQLINWLSHRGICLGRSPGFRKRDVERFISQHAWPIGMPLMPIQAVAVAQ
ncbi:hypothetical protein KXW98_005123 [Aspergillus fumigatus]|nr:hypothetical protein KXX48_004785 [Aspergillus fumigatus]KAH1342087.1 hypothetical protein KXX33_004466 [Aspergillus fumigatus]KAH1368744.1 hypothetical protein KXX63_008578 [Aspergillus fumigatus]KAH1373118.1 hypothetical protein KXX10_003706 [Aspergillus fumigatus]KAH1459496.1 hypothetical protein KXX53_004754 [Aspergillus fumigatus]